MGWTGVLVLFLFVLGVYRLIVNLQDARKQREEEMLFARRQLAIAQRRLAEIGEAYKNYKSIDLQTRIRLRALAEERIEREDLYVRPGDIEAAVVKMFERSHVRE